MDADVVVYAQNGQPILVALTRAQVIGPDSARYLLDYLEEQVPYFLFGLVVDLKTMRFRKFGETDSAEFACVLETPEILKHYFPEFETVEVYGPLLEGLTESWLADLAYHWKFASPPESEALDAIGLLPKIKGGITRRGVAGGAYALRGD